MKNNKLSRREVRDVIRLQLRCRATCKDIQSYCEDIDLLNDDLRHLPMLPRYHLELSNVSAGLRAVREDLRALRLRVQRDEGGE